MACSVVIIDTSISDFKFQQNQIFASWFVHQSKSNQIAAVALSIRLISCVICAVPSLPAKVCWRFLQNQLSLLVIWRSKESRSIERRYWPCFFRLLQYVSCNFLSFICLYVIVQFRERLFLHHIALNLTRSSMRWQWIGFICMRKLSILLNDYIRSCTFMYTFVMPQH